MTDSVTPLPIGAWSGADADAMAEERAERWRLRYEAALKALADIEEALDLPGIWHAPIDHASPVDIVRDIRAKLAVSK